MTTLEEQIESGEVDALDLYLDVKERLLNLGFHVEDVKDFMCEHFQNLITFDENLKEFLKFMELIK